MKERFIQWWAGLHERERWILAGGAVVVVLTFAWLLLDPLFNGVSERAQRVAEKEELLAWMQRGAARLPQGGGTTAPTTAPVFIINRTVQSAGLGPYLKQAQPVGETGVRTQFEAVPFDTLVLWLSQLASQHGLRIESAQLENAGRAGTADARLSLQRGGS
jgi:type II secretory pathway component PulM